MITREEALRKVRQNVGNANLVNHMVAVSAILKRVAQGFGENSDLWELVGMLHDIDYEETGGDWDRHGLVSAEMVSDALPDEALHAIRAHNPRTGVETQNRLDVALIAADALSGLVVATALMMPDKKLSTVKVRSLRRKFKDASFARGVSRENLAMCTEIGISLEDFFTLGLTSMQSVSEEIGL